MLSGARVADIANMVTTLAGLLAVVAVALGGVFHLWWPDTGLLVWQLGAVAGVVCLVALVVLGFVDSTPDRSGR